MTEEKNMVEKPDYLRFVISEIYVRDHLLIQFMLHNYAPISFSEYGKHFEEDVYEKWTQWLKEREEAHGERSTI